MSTSQTCYNDIGNRAKVELYHVDDESLEKLNESAKSIQGFMEYMFLLYAEGDESVVNGIGTKKEVLDKKYIFNDALGHAFFGVLKIPSASDYVYQKNDKRLDAIRGYLYTIAKNYLVVVTIEMSPSEEDILTTLEKKDYIDSFYFNLIF